MAVRDLTVLSKRQWDYANNEMKEVLDESPFNK
jgi:hypothetical protein